MPKFIGHPNGAIHPVPDDYELNGKGAHPPGAQNIRDEEERKVGKGYSLEQLQLIAVGIMFDCVVFLVHILSYSAAFIGPNATPLSMNPGVGDFFLWTDMTVEGLLAYMLALGTTAIPTAIYYVAHREGVFRTDLQSVYRGKKAAIAFAAITALLFVALIEFYSFLTLFKSVGADPFNPGSGMDGFKAMLCAGFATALQQILALISGGIYQFVLKKE